MRVSVIIIFCFIFSLESVFSNTHIIYADISKKNIADIESEIKEIVSNIEDESFILYISNGNNPLICEERQKLSNVFEELNYMPVPSRPDPFTDVDSLNAIITEKQLLKNINKKQRQLQKAVKFYFFLHHVDYYNHIEKIVKEIILTNRLKNENGLLNKCHVSVFIDKDKTRKKIKKYQKDYKYYDIKKY